MNRAAVAVLVLAPALAHADAAKPDPLAEDKAREANLEDNGPRRGVTLAVVLGGGVLIANGGTDKIPAASFRLGHVATPNTIITFELTGGTFRHRAALQGPDLYDGTGSFLVGAQYYVAPSVWIRGSGGLNVHTHDNGMTSTNRPGPAGSFGAGLDVIVRRLWRLDVEVWGVAGIDADGLLWTSSLGLGLARY